MEASPPAAVAAGVAPTVPVGRAWTVRFALIWLGLWAAQLASPRRLAPLLASLVIAQLGGYGVLFAVAGVFTVLGAASVGRIRSVR